MLVLGDFAHEPLLIAVLRVLVTLNSGLVFGRGHRTLALLHAADEHLLVALVGVHVLFQVADQIHASC